eukprot:144053-Hanusia_phi.AAC.4
MISPMRSKIDARISLRVSGRKRRGPQLATVPRPRPWLLHSPSRADLTRSNLPARVRDAKLVGLGISDRIIPAAPTHYLV